MVALKHQLDLMAWLNPIREVGRRITNDTPAWREIGEVALNRVRSNFLESRGAEPWAELAPSTLLNRARGVSGRGQVFKRGASIGPASREEHRLLERTESASGHFARTQLGRDIKRSLTSRARKAVEGAKPLIWTGRLLRSNYVRVGQGFAEVYNPLVQAKRLFFGWTESKPNTPARNPYYLRPEDRAEISNILLRWIFSPLAGFR
jgi:hypothetical protein